MKYKYILSNPTQDASLPRYRRSKVQVLDEGEVSRFLGAAIYSKHNALYHVALKTGMRQGELFGLQWSDLKWYRGIMYVTRQVQRIPKQGWKFTPQRLILETVISR